MIKGAEIHTKANENHVRDQQIEKDYILSWILQAIAHHKDLATKMAFKGGTVLKKIYFEVYRFSEDLDFTILTECSDNQIFLWFNDLFEYVKKEANIPLSIVEKTNHDDGGINFYISYTGPLGGMGNNKRIKIDIARSESLTFSTDSLPAIISYSDLTPHRLLCYRLEEILVEKLRAVMQRTQARDFYDLWYLTEVHGMQPEYFVSEFIKKCESKQIDPSDFPKKLNNKIPMYKGQWDKSLKDQVQEIPDFERVEREVSRNLKNFKSKIA